jgi:hypothetical protein
MNVHVRMGMVFVLGGFLGWSIKATEPSDAKLLMALPFDGSACATQAVGNPAPLEEQGLVYGPGVRGQAAAFTRGVRLTYARPANLRQEEGTVMFWFKPNWSTVGLSDTTMDQQKWRCLFSEPRPDDTRELAGRGTLWLWFWGSLYRGDIGLYKGAFRTADVSMESGVWQHLAFTWSVKGQRLYWNGRLVADGTKSLAQLKGDKGKSFAFGPDKFATFFVGNHKGGEPADGWIDEFKIYDRILTKRQIDKEIAQTLAVSLTITTPYIMPGTDSVAWTLQTLDGASDPCRTYRYTIKNAEGQSVAHGDVKTDNGCTTLHTPFHADTPGAYRLELCRNEHPEPIALLSDQFCVLEATNRHIGPLGSDLKKTEVVSIHVPDWVGMTNYTDVGKTCIGRLKGQTYVEAGPELHDRFAIRLSLPEDQAPYWVEWTYPDDKRRTQEIVMQSAIAGGTSNVIRRASSAAMNIPTPEPCRRSKRSIGRGAAMWP